MTPGPITGVGIGTLARTAARGIGIPVQTVEDGIGTRGQTAVHGTLGDRIAGPGILAVQTAGVGEVGLWDCA